MFLATLMVVMSLSLEVPSIQVVSEVVSQLEGAFALLIKSTHFPTELIAAKKGSPLLLGATLSSFSFLMALMRGLIQAAEQQCRPIGKMIWRAHDHARKYPQEITDAHSASSPSQ